MDVTTKAMEDDDEVMIVPYIFEEIIEVFQDACSAREARPPINNLIAYMIQ